MEVSEVKIDYYYYVKSLDYTRDTIGIVREMTDYIGKFVYIDKFDIDYPSCFHVAHPRSGERFMLHVGDLIDPNDIKTGPGKIILTGRTGEYVFDPNELTV